MKIGKNTTSLPVNYLCKLHYLTYRFAGFRVFGYTLICIICLSCVTRDPNNIPELKDYELSLDTQWLAKGLRVPWQMAYAGNGNIFFTEKRGLIKKLNTSSGLVEISYQFDSLATEIQTGLLGLCLHPQFSEIPYLYTAQTYYSGDEIMMRIVRLTFESDKLLAPQVIIDSIPSFLISAGGRLTIGADRKLYVTVGEGKFGEKAQDVKHKAGKILRYNLDGSIPADNPFPGNPAYVMGMRNPQGIVQTPFGLYSTEHGNFSHDEINFLYPGANYGWPLWGGRCLEPNDSCKKYDFKDPLFDWSPCIAPSGLTYYDGEVFPEWDRCLLMACLKEQQIKVLQLSKDGTKILAEKDYLQGVLGRIRDILVLPDGSVLAATSNEDVYGTSRNGGDKIIEINPGKGNWQKTEATTRKFLPLIKLDSTTLQIQIVAKNLKIPQQMIWGPDAWIWFCERDGKIKKINPQTNALILVYEVPGVYESKDNSGMQAFTLHPSFPASPLLYIHYCTSLRKSMLVRLELNPNLTSVVAQDTLLELPAAYTHNGSRLLFGPDSMLYFCTGDALKKRTAQDLEKLTGKVLRLTPEGQIPGDNPFPNSYVWSYGHRNTQGLIFAPNGILYATEHGESTDDEINLIQKGKNYGYPKILGYCDERSEKQFCQKYNIIEPLLSVTPTIAMAGMAYYNHPSIPEWQNSLLVTTLKAGNGNVGQRLIHCKLNTEGDKIETVNEYFSHSFGRLRDILVTPDGRIFISTSNQESNGNGAQVVNETDDLIVEIKAMD